MTILIQAATFIAAIGVLILLVIKGFEIAKAIKNIDKNKIREEKEKKEKDALAKLIRDAQAKIDAINSKKK